MRLRDARWLILAALILCSNAELFGQKITASCLANKRAVVWLNCYDHKNTPDDYCVSDGWFWCACGGLTPACFEKPISSECNTCPCRSRGGKSSDSCVAGKPIDLASGSTYIIHADVGQLPGLGKGLLLERVWQSMWPASQSGFALGMFGKNWRATYEERVFLGSDGLWKYSRETGGYWSFWNLGNQTTTLALPANQTATLVVGSDLTITFQDGEKRTFDGTSGSLKSIVDRYGNTTTLSYDAANRLVSVTDPVQRHLCFSYPNPSAVLVSSVTSDVGLTISYAYDVQGRLITVTENDGSQYKYEYDSNSKITAVKDAQGKVLEAHTYDAAGRGLTSVRAGGVEAITVKYKD